MKKCKKCGKKINPKYTLCYECHLKNQKSHFKKPLKKGFLNKCLDLIKAIFYLPCPKCKMHDNKLLKSTLLFKWFNEESHTTFDQKKGQSVTNTVKIPMGKFKKTRQCNYCGNIWSFEKDGKL